MDRRDTSNVPPPRSYTMIWLSPPLLSRPYAIAMAVGSLMMQRTCRPAMMPASLVAWHCTLLKYVGTVTVMVMTMCVTLCPMYASVVSFIFMSTMVLTSPGIYMCHVSSVTSENTHTGSMYKVMQ